MITSSISATNYGAEATRVPEPAVFELCGIAAGFAGIYLWHRSATQKNRRRGYVRKRRTEKPMAWI